MKHSKETKFEPENFLEREPIHLDTFSISQQLEHKTVLVTGGAGSIGSELVRQILKFSPSRVVVLDHSETPLHLLNIEVNELPENAMVKVHFELGDVKSIDTVEHIFKKYTPQVIYHAAAYKHIHIIEENPSQAIFANVLGTRNVADLAVKYGAETFVMISTDKVVNPGSVMGASKLIAERYVQALYVKQVEDKVLSPTKFITTRFGNVLGSRGSVVPLFISQIEKGGPVTLTHPSMVRYFMTIKESCQLVLEAGAMGKGAEIFIFNMGQPVKIYDLAHKMIRSYGLEPGKDIKIEITGLRLGERLDEQLIDASAIAMPSHNVDIMIVKEKSIPYATINTCITELERLALKFEGGNIIQLLLEILPEYKTNNPYYAEFIKNAQTKA